MSTNSTFENLEVFPLNSGFTDNSVDEEAYMLQEHTLNFLTSNFVNTNFDRPTLTKIIELDTLNLAEEISNEELYEGIKGLIAVDSTPCLTEEVVVTEIEKPLANGISANSSNEEKPAEIVEPVAEVVSEPIVENKKPTVKKAAPTKHEKIIPAKPEKPKQEIKKPVEVKPTVEMTPVVSDAISFVNSVSTSIKQIDKWFKAQRSTEHGVDVTIVKKDIFDQRIKQYLETNLAVAGLLSIAGIKIGDEPVNPNYTINGQVLVNGLAILISEVKQLREKETKFSTLEKNLFDAQDQIRKLQMEITQIGGAAEKLKQREADDAKYRLLEKTYVLARNNPDTGKLFFVGSPDQQVTMQMLKEGSFDIRKCRSVDNLGQAFRFSSLDAARDYLNRIVALKLAKGKQFALKSTNQLSVHEIIRRQVKSA